MADLLVWAFIGTLVAYPAGGLVIFAHRVYLERKQ